MPAPQPPPPWRIVPEPGSRLEQLLDSVEAAKARADEAEAQAKSITEAIKAEAVRLAPPGTTVIILAGAAHRPEFTVGWQETWRLNSKQLKAEQLVTWVKYAVKSGTWKLTKAK
jgi:hypothetical protein